MLKKRKKNWILVTIYSFLIVVVSFFLLVSIDLLVKSLNPEKHNKQLSLAYNTLDKVSYTVDLLESDLSNNYNTDMDKSYISSLIDKMNFNVYFEYNSSKQLDYDYEYRITAYLTGEYVNQNVWKKKYEIVPSTINTIYEDNYLEINKTFEIDYQMYSEVANNLKKETSLNLNTYLDIVFEVYITSPYMSKIDVQNLVNIKIPLAQELTKVTYNQNGYVSESIYESKKVDEKTSLFIKIMYLCGTIISTLLELMLLYRLAKLTSKDRFLYEIEGVFKLYKDILIEVEEIPFHKQYGNIEVTNFTDLVDVSNKLCLPILYKKIGEDYHFFIITDKFFYNYLVRRRFFYNNEK